MHRGVRAGVSVGAQAGWRGGRRAALARIFHTAHETPTACSRRREEADPLRHALRPPPHVGGYEVCEMSTLAEIMNGSAQLRFGAERVARGIHAASLLKRWFVP